MKLPHVFEGQAVPEQFAAGDTIFERGQPGEVMYIVKEGEVDLWIHGRVVETVAPEGFFGEMALIDHEPRSATAVARTDCTLLPITLKQFSYMVQETPFFAIRVMKVMASRLRRAGAAGQRAD
jgi:CRP/FNR family transcriptional regulator, cyclic AMP receptor protein